MHLLCIITTFELFVAVLLASNMHATLEYVCLFVNRPPGAHLPLPTNDDPPDVLSGWVHHVCLSARGSGMP